ncbi:hypothetical protein [Candidatus Lucifugimonas marina]|uniref:Uncharacterized protein n=1 Tax=Candidatus Lucifugimonas marina TaxID=3038979 RepID=A0AAJ5ZJV7_9CHLR|nr:hypothetical protein [SAR202 cluster bacterium JH702]MDG0868923.1 hypothetical protein [SAR202 cluster bacterium JH639]WFG35551.1 hypothetical protein GKN94_07540 [SAR202 cluster bacterium JH545]WFG39498.1 hypothetical protein GKO48_07655 [SAR202 cluster bacterium JH1073]
MSFEQSDAANPYPRSWRNIKEVAGMLILDQVPYRKAYGLFGSPRYKWEQVDPWMVISFAVGLHMASSQEVQDWIVDEPGSQYQKAMVNQMLEQNPRSLSDARVFPHLFFPISRGDESYTSTFDYLAAYIDHGATFGVFGGQSALDIVEPWINNRGMDAFVLEFRDNQTPLDFWRPRPSFADIKAFAESQLSPDL